MAGVAWDIDFNGAFLNSNALGIPNYARCVWAPSGDDDDDDDDDSCALILNNDGTATDPCSGHMWQVDESPYAYDWADAQSYCAGLALAATSTGACPTSTRCAAWFVGALPRKPAAPAT